MVAAPGTARNSIDDCNRSRTDWFALSTNRFLHSGQLVRVLEDWSPSFEGLFLYYPGHRQVPAALRAFIDMIKAAPSAGLSGSSFENPFAVGGKYQSSR